MLTTMPQIMFHTMLITILQNPFNLHFNPMAISETTYLSSQLKILIKDSILITITITTIRKIMLNPKCKLTTSTLIMIRDIIPMEEVLIQDSIRSVKKLERDFDQYFIMNYYFNNYYHHIEYK